MVHRDSQITDEAGGPAGGTPTTRTKEHRGGSLPGQDPPSLVLPTLVFGVIEVRRLVRELEALDEYMRQAGLREAGTKQDTLPRISRLLDEISQANQLNLLQSDDRHRLTDFLQQILDTAPTVHISFASDPSATFTAKIVEWLRRNVHPYTLVRLGLQPSIAAGCVLRTANKSFDFSLRHRFDDQRVLLLQALDAESNPDSHSQTPIAAGGAA